MALNLMSLIRANGGSNLTNTMHLLSDCPQFHFYHSPAHSKLSFLSLILFINEHGLIAINRYYSYLHFSTSCRMKRSLLFKTSILLLSGFTNSHSFSIIIQISSIFELHLYLIRFPFQPIYLYSFILLPILSLFMSWFGGSDNYLINIGKCTS